MKLKYLFLLSVISVTPLFGMDQTISNDPGRINRRLCEGILMTYCATRDETAPASGTSWRPNPELAQLLEEFFSPLVAFVRQEGVEITDPKNDAHSLIRVLKEHEVARDVVLPPDQCEKIRTLWQLNMHHDLLYILVRAGHFGLDNQRALALMSYLIEHYAELRLNKTKLRVLLAQQFGKTHGCDFALDNPNLLHLAIFDGNAEAAGMLADVEDGLLRESEVDLPFDEDYNGFFSGPLCVTPLALAALMGRLPCCRALLQSNADCTGLYVMRLCSSCRLFLKPVGAAITFISRSYQHWRAEQDGRAQVEPSLPEQVMELLGLLLERAGHMGQADFFWCFRIEEKFNLSPARYDQLVKVFLLKAPEHVGVVLLKTYKGDTPLHYAARLGFEDVAQHYCENPEMIDATNAEDLTPLHLAAMNNHGAIISLLAAGGAQVDRPLDRNGNTALHYACAHQCDKSAHALLEAGASLTAQNQYGQTPCCLLVEKMGGQHNLDTLAAVLDHVCAQNGYVRQSGRPQEEQRPDFTATVTPRTLGAEMVGLIAALSLTVVQHNA